MKIEETAGDAASSPDEKYWYRVGSIAAIALGIGYIVIIPLYARVGAPMTVVTLVFGAWWMS